jgi:xanthine dehydrogenase accessory factor
MKEIDFWKFINQKLNAKLTVILMVVAETSKSSPGRAGFKMAVSSDGHMTGTVGGGIMEHKLVEESRKYLNKNSNVNLVKKLFHNKTAHGEKSGLICGGTETIILKTLTARDIKFVTGLISSYDNLSGGTLQIDNSGIGFVNNKNKSKEISLSYKSENDWFYRENSGFPDTIYIIGGGHIGLAVSKIMSLQDFYIVIIDPRKDIPTMDNNTFADKKLVIPYEEVGDHLIESDRTYAAVVTYGHDNDLIALKSIIHKKLKYIGLMGSKRKIKNVSNELIESGVTPELLKKIHTPIGIEIGAESPEEIAVSIAAEIIKVKNEKTV